MANKKKDSGLIQCSSVHNRTTVKTDVPWNGLVMLRNVWNYPNSQVY